MIPFALLLPCVQITAAALLVGHRTTEINPIAGGLLLLTIAFISYKLLHARILRGDAERFPTLEKWGLSIQKVAIGAWLLLGLIALGRGLYDLLFG